MSTIKKLWGEILGWFLFTFRNPVLSKSENGSFKVVFRRYWMEIRSLSDNFRMRVMICEHPYGYLLFGARNGNEKNVHAFCEYVYAVVMTLTTDQKFANEVQRSLGRCYERRANAELKKTSKERDDATAISEVMQQVEADKMSRKDRRKIIRELKKEINDGRKADN